MVCATGYFKEPACSNVEGTGLGLSVVKKLMDAMNGRVGVEREEPGKGSTFWIELPQYDRQATGTDQSMTSVHDESITRKKGTILYIEDNSSNVELVEHILSGQQPDIRLISSPYGKHAVGLATEYFPDLILLDLNLPDIHAYD